MPVDTVAHAVEWYRANIDQKFSTQAVMSAIPRPAQKMVSEAVAEAYDIAVARAKREHHEANMAEMRESQMAGSMVDRADVERRVADAAALIRMALERIPDKLADLLAAESNPDACRALMVAEVDQVLDDLAAVRLA